MSDRPVFILICGGRNLNHADAWNALERDCLDAVAEKLRLPHKFTFRVVHGGATGADSAAGDWAKSNGVKVTSYPANWKKHGKSAGPIRNKQMLDECDPDIVVALPGGKGTANMVAQAEERNIPVVKINVRRDGDHR